MTVRMMVGDVFDQLAQLPDGSVDLVCTSPPFLGVRSYLPADHPDKGREIGHEATPGEYLATLLALTAECGRDLAAHGAIFVELGDSYAGAYSGHHQGTRPDVALSRHSGKAIRDGANRQRDRQQDEASGILPPRLRTRRRLEGWPRHKGVVGVPWLYPLCLSYGFNLLTGEPSPAGDWIVRNLVAWCKPNPTPGDNGDKFRPATTYMTSATLSERRYWDGHAVRTVNHPDRMGERAGGWKNGSDTSPLTGWTSDDGGEQNPAGAPPLDHWWDEPDEFDDDAWKVAPSTYRGAHFATWPAKLLERPILAMCPPKVCTTCGEPSRRIVRPTDAYLEARGGTGDSSSHDRGTSDLAVGNAPRPKASGFKAEHDTIGWTDCGHDTWRAGHVLDPFGGSGTTGIVASGHGRDCTLIDLDSRNADLARERLGMLLEVVG